MKYTTPIAANKGMIRKLFEETFAFRRMEPPWAPTGVKVPWSLKGIFFDFHIFLCINQKI